MGLPHCAIFRVMSNTQTGATKPIAYVKIRVNDCCRKLVYDLFHSQNPNNTDV